MMLIKMEKKYIDYNIFMSFSPVTVNSKSIFREGKTSSPIKIQGNGKGFLSYDHTSKQTNRDYYFFIHIYGDKRICIVRSSILYTNTQ